MLSRSKRSLAYGASAACIALYSSAVHAQQTFNIGVAANFAVPLAAIINAFNNNYYPGGPGDSIGLSSNSTGALQAAIIAGGTSGPYDLFLAANTQGPAAVSTLGMIYAGVTQSPFFYATGSLLFVAQNVNIADCPTPGAGNSCGLPTTGSSLYTNFVIANPTNAPYGLAGEQVINQSPWNLNYPTSASTFPASYVNTAANIDLTYQAVNDSPPAYAYGFVAKSQVCYQGTFNSTTNINYTLEYLYNGATSPNFGATQPSPQTYPQIVQNGIAIQLSAQTTATKAEVIKFIQYLSGTAPGDDGQGLAIIQNYCYGTTPP